MAKAIVTGTVVSIKPFARQMVLDNGLTYNLRYFPMRRFVTGQRVSVTYDDTNGGRTLATVQKT